MDLFTQQGAEGTKRSDIDRKIREYEFETA